VKKNKFIQKTVIRADGTYGTELVEVEEDNEEWKSTKESEGFGGEKIVLHKIRTWLMKSEVFALCTCRALGRALC